MSTSRIAVNRNSDGSGDAGDFHDVDTDLIDGSAQPISNAAPAAVAAPAAEAEAATSGVGGVIMELSAAEALVAAARGSPGQLVVVALGPLTNLALALRIEPQLPSLLRALLVLGGGEGEYGGNVTPYAEFNFHADPEAAAEVVRGFGDAASNCRRSHSSNGASCFPGVKGPGGEPRIALVTWYCCQQNLLHWDVVDELMAVAGGDVALADPAAAGIAEGAAASHSPSQRGSFMKGILAPFLTRWRGDSPNGMLLGDPLAVAVAMGLQPTGAKKAQLVTSTPGCGQLSQLHQQGYAVKSADFGAGPIQPPWEQQGTSLSGGLVLNPPASDQWGGLVLDYYVAPCRVELQGERRGACVYGCSHVQHDTIVTKADMMKDARCVLHVNDKGPDGLNGAEASPNAEMRLVTVIRSIHIPTVAEMLRRVLS
ncbi:hypothetical protein Vafri_6927 [Volvox africanus]|uniref:Inosine/uridine-preferring nucleoside hydrolase domain-containing protein n=1 Tax=Volvox africanus TaxID=51714 RepID=A0A8J4EYM4_9CHLO|nr:hypothetical protein Vafri_6927 [Volvox africanus]